MTCKIRICCFKEVFLPNYEKQILKKKLLEQKNQRKNPKLIMENMIVVKWISKLVLKIVMKEGCKLGLNCSLGSSKNQKEK